MVLKQNYLEKLRVWVIPHYFQLALFNIIIMFFLLLRSAGYFEPFFLITINLVVFISLILAIIILGVGSEFLFGISIAFWMFASFIRVFGINVWAERTTIYVFQALFLGVLIILIKSILLKIEKKK